MEWFLIVPLALLGLPILAAFIVVFLFLFVEQFIYLIGPGR